MKNRVVVALLLLLVVGAAFYFTLRLAPRDAPPQEAGQVSVPTSGAAPDVLVAPADFTAAAPAAEPASRGEQADDSRIVNGENANPADFPWIAALAWRDGAETKAYCAGTVIGERWLLTAAHCKVLAGDVAIVGRADLATEAGRVIPIARVVPHPAYDSQTLDHDVALLQLEDDARVARAPIVLEDELALRRSTEIAIAGWGRLGESNYQTPNMLQRAFVKVSAQNSCVDNYAAISRVVTDFMFCAQGMRPQSQGGGITDACQGDSGGPMVAFDRAGHKAQLVGVISKGAGCARPLYPGVYARISKLRNWILKCMDQPDLAECNPPS